MLVQKTPAKYDPIQPRTFLGEFSANAYQRALKQLIQFTMSDNVIGSGYF
jgi:hypothetical protein